MPLITRGRLSVQRVSAKCWDVILTMADKGGWDNMSFEKKKATTARHPVDDTTKQPKEQLPRQANIKRGRKRKVSTGDEGEILAPRRKSLRGKR